MNNTRSSFDRRGRDFSAAGRSIVGQSQIDYEESGDVTRNVAETSSSPSSSYLSPSIEPHPVVPGLTTDFVRFYNVAPRTRKVRRAQLDKETLEKQRLKDRTGGYHTYDEFQRVVGYESGTPGFQTEAQRFDRDSAGEEQRLRKSRLQRQNLILEKRREENRQREERRIRLEEEKRTAEKERWRALQNDPMAGKKNVGSTPYDQITLRYNDGKDGQRLKYQDSLVKWRAAHRARRLQGEDDGRKRQSDHGPATEAHRSSETARATLILEFASH